MSKPEWGIKRTCQGCGARFYDLNHDPIVCPKCGTRNDPAAPVKQRRQAAAKPVESPRPPAVVPDIEATAVEGVPEDTDEEEGDEIIEDTSDLGEDEDDVSEVKEHIEDEGGR